MQGPDRSGLALYLILCILGRSVEALITFKEWEVSGVVVIDVGDVQISLDARFLLRVGGLIGLFLQLLAQSFGLFPLYGWRVRN